MLTGEQSSTDVRVNRTPKRTAQLQKRRISDSPLMYAPLKVKLKKEERDMNIFMANFEQFNNLLDPPEEEPEPSTSEKWHFKSQNLINSEKNPETSDEVEMRLVYPVDETRMDTVSEKQNVTNLNDFFNDEIDDSMVRCSQQVEEEILGRINEETVSPTLFSDKENKSSTNDNRGSRKIEGLHNLMKIPLEKQKQIEVPKTPVAKNKYIPDDSFDECLSQFEEVDFTSEIKNTDGSRFKSKDLQNQKSEKSLVYCSSNNTGIKLGSSKSCCILDSKKPLALNINEKIFAKTKSFDSSNRETYRNGVKNLANDFVQKNEKKPESHISPRKFFKSKSLSEPLHNDPLNSSASNNNNQETKNNSRTENKRKLIGKSFQCKIYSDSSVNRSVENLNNKALGSSQDSMISIGNKFDNVQLSNLNRSMERLQDQRTTESQAILCTPQEIERKRKEAKMKLEARRRLQALQSSKITNPGSSLPIPQSIKR